MLQETGFPSTCWGTSPKALLSSSRTLRELGEVNFLRQLARRCRTGADGPVLGIGDDAAVLQLPPKHQLVVSTDMLVEHVDFERSWASMSDVGHKAAAVNLSDLAAMGARGHGLLASLALSPHTRVADAMRLLLAVHRVGRRFEAPLVGGDLSATDGPLSLSLTAMGSLPAGTALRRHAANVGDLVLVSGVLGLAAAGLCGLQARASGRTVDVPSRLRRAQLRPTPLVGFGRALRRCGRVTACTDVSDGLAKDAQNLAGPGAEVVLDLGRLPCVPGVPRTQAVAWALHGGEDYQLVCSAPAAAMLPLQTLARRCGLRLTHVGEVVRRRRASVDTDGGGYDHFRQGVNALFRAGTASKRSATSP
jgi:thiamine-monophosphate kinase